MTAFGHTACTVLRPAETGYELKTVESPLSRDLAISTYERGILTDQMGTPDIDTARWAVCGALGMA